MPLQPNFGSVESSNHHPCSGDVSFHHHCSVMTNTGLQPVGSQMVRLSSTLPFSLTEENVNEMVDAIWRVEGGEKTKFPYGIKSVKVKNATEAREVCKRTIRHYWQLFYISESKQAKANDTYIPRTIPPAFINFSADKYCPPSVDKIGNLNWKKNLTSILYGSKKERHA